MLEGCYKGVSSVLEGIHRDVEGVFHRHFKVVTRVLQKYYIILHEA